MQFYLVDAILSSSGKKLSNFLYMNLLRIIGQMFASIQQETRRSKKQFKDLFLSEQNFSLSNLSLLLIYLFLPDTQYLRQTCQPCMSIYT